MTIDKSVVPNSLVGVAQMVEPGTRYVVARRGTEEASVEVVIAEGQQKTIELAFQSPQPDANQAPLPPPAPLTAAPAASPPRAPQPPPATDGLNQTDEGKIHRVAALIAMGALA